MSLLSRAGPRSSKANIPYDPPHYLLFTPDGTRILHGSKGDTIRVWDTSLRELIKIQTEDVSQVGDWARLLDDHIIVSGTSKGSYNFWDVTFGTPIRFCTASPGSRGLDFTRLASAPNEFTAQSWETILGDPKRWQGDPRVCNQTHNRVAYISEDSIFVDANVDAKTSNTRVGCLNMGLKPREDFKLSPTGKFISFRLPSSAVDSFLWCIDTETVYRLEKSLFPRGFYGREWSPDGYYIAIERYSDFTLWDTRTGALVSILDFGRAFGDGPPWNGASNGKLCFSLDGRCFAAADGGRIKLWDMKSAIQRGPYRASRTLSFREDGAVIV